MTAGVEPTPDWLTNLAGVWVERWLAHGGSLIVDRDCNGVSMMMAERGWRGWRNKSSPHRDMRHWKDGWKVGRWRELSEMSGYIPGLREAIVHHVALNGQRDPSGSIFMWCSAEDMGVV